MAAFQPPPTWASPVIVDETTGRASFHPVWLKWFVDLTGVLSSAAGSGGSIVHNNTTSKQGGTTGQFFHLTSAEYTGSGTGVFLRTTSPTMVTPVLGVPTSGTLTNCTGLPVATGISGLGANVATFLATPSSANLAAAVTGKTGTGALVFGSTPTLTTPVLANFTVAGLPAAGTLGRRAIVTDATAPTFLAAVAGGGAVVTPVFDNGTNWIVG